MDASVDSQKISLLFGEMSTSIASVRTVVQSLKQGTAALDFKDGISLLSLKHHSLLMYLNSLVLLSSRRAIGHSLNIRAPPDLPFSSSGRPCRGHGSGDLVDSMLEGRAILEKIRVLETRMRYQIEKLLRVAEEHEDPKNAVDGKDPLAFRPNPQNLVANGDSDHNNDNENESQIRAQKTHNVDDTDAIYRPPRVAPVPYVEKSKSQLRRERPPIPSALASLSADASRPHIESTSGLGSTPSLVSGRAAHLKRMTEFEEENFSRLVMKKSDARRRAQDEADVALGGSLSGGSGKTRRRAGGLADEFGDVLRSVERASFGGPGGGRGDGYDELRQRSKKPHILQKSRDATSRKRTNPADDGDLVQSGRKRSRFELEAKNAKKKLNKSRR
ncbi:hypothetical protein H0H93_012146 [Arthromyces matolae]|nr:hypothetical protein H0H93_012146 [Arthromyces matolae]